MKYLINFARYDKKKEKRKAFIRFFSGAVILILLAGFVFGIKRIGSVTGERRKVVEAREELLKRVEKQAQERRKHFSDAEVLIIDGKLKFYRAVSENKLFVTVFLNLLEEKTPRFISLRSLDFDPARKNFVLMGESLSPDGVTAFIPNLQGSNIITKIEITRQNFQKVGEKKILISEFEIRGELI